MTTPYTRYPVGGHALCQTSCRKNGGAGISLNSLTFGQGGVNPPLWAFLISKTPGNHTLGQDILFVVTLYVRPLVSNREREK